MAQPTRARELWIVGLGAAALIALVGCATGQTPPTMSDVEARIDALAKDVTLLDDFSRLEMPKDEVTRLVALLEDLQAHVAQRNLRRVDVLLRLEAQLQAQRDLLLRDEPVPMAVTGQIDELQAELVDFDANTEQELLTAYSLKIKEILTPEQIDALTWADETRMQAVDYLNWVRELSEEDFELEAPMAAESLSEGRNITADEVAQILRTARALSDAEYDAGRLMLADRLMPALRDNEVSPDVILIRRMQPPRLLSLLKEKLAIMQ